MNILSSILSKFDEAKALAEKAILSLESEKKALEEKRDVLINYEKELKLREAGVSDREKAVESAAKILKTQDELDKLVDEAKQRLIALENEEKDRRAKFVKKENEIIVREENVSKKEKELAEGFKRLKEEMETYKEKIIKEMANKLGSV